MTDAVGWTVPPAPGAPSRGVGLLNALREGLPPWAVDAFEVFTHLGAAWLLLALAAAAYLGYERRGGGFVIAALFLGFAVTISLKAGLALPRPPAAVRTVAVSGFGFPSGHALNATVGWGALALALERVSTGRRRLGVAGSIVAIVAVSRVAIGVHYLVDVAVGAVLGLGVIGVALMVWRDEPVALFGLAGAVAVLGVALTGAGLEAVALVGACAAAIVSWQAVDPEYRDLSRRNRRVVAGALLVVTGAGALAAPTVGLAFGAGATATAAIVAGPVAWERWIDR